MRVFVMFLFLSIGLACSEKNPDAPATENPSTEKNEIAQILGEGIYQGIDFHTPVDSIRMMPEAMELSGSHIRFEGSSSLGRLVCEVEHDGQFVQSIEIKLNPEKKPSKGVFHLVEEHLTLRYGEGNGQHPYSVWILDFDGKPLIELSLEEIAGKKGNSVKISYFLRQYI